MEEERERRLDPDNRPDGVEVDNTDRTFDADHGMFTDNDEYDEAARSPTSTRRTPTARQCRDEDDDDSEDDDSESRRLRGRRLRRRRVRRRRTSPRRTQDEEQDEAEDELLRVLLAGAAGSIGRVRRPRPGGARARGRRRRPARPGGRPRRRPHRPGGRRGRRRRGPPRRGRAPRRHPDERSLTESLHSHVVSTAALLEAMVRHDVPRLVYASSNHAVGRTAARRGRPRASTRCRGPTRSTAWARSRPRRCCSSTPTATASTSSPPGSARSCRSRPRRRHLSTWLSPDDAVRMFEAPGHHRARARRALRHLGQHPRLVGPRARPRPRLRPAGRRRGLGRRHRDPPPHARRTTTRPPSSAAPSPRRASSGPPST